jgi:O-antigen/teichoic acid export membrane protein
MSLALPQLEILSSRERLRASLTSWLPWVGKGSFALLDQGLFAGANFIVNILLARWLTPSEYGAFAVAFSVFLLLGLFHTAILTEPMMVFGPGKYREGIPRYLGILLRGHFALMLPAAALLAVAAFLLGRLYSPAVERAFLGLALATPFILLLWLVRRAFYVRLQPAWAAAGGGLYMLTLLACIYALRDAGHLSPFTGFAAMGLGSVVVSLLLLIPLDPRGLVAQKEASASTVTADHWRYGRWAIATAGVAWFPTNIYFVLLPAWVGLEQAGALKALINLAMPVLLGISGLSLLFLPVLSRQSEEGRNQSMNRTLWLSLGLFFLGSAIYLCLLWGLRVAIFQLLYGGKYREFAGWPLLVVGLWPFGQAVTATLGNALRARQRPDYVFWSSVGGTAATLILGIPLAWRFGVSGALAGSLLAFLATGGFMLLFYEKSLPRCEGQNAIGLPWAEQG